MSSGSRDRLNHWLRRWFAPDSPPLPQPVPAAGDARRRRMLTVEVIIVFTITLGFAGLRSLLSLVDSLLRTTSLSDQSVAINAPQATNEVIDLLRQLLSATQLVAWGALGAYLLWRGGTKLAEVGLPRRPQAADLRWSIGLAALIGIPGLLFYLAMWQFGLNLAVQPSTLDQTWWRPITLTLSAFGNGFAEEILVVGYLITRLRQLGMSENASLIISAVLRGSYHLYQGFGGFLGNVAMGLIFGRVWQRTNRLWPLVAAHTLLDVFAFVGYALLRDHVSWLP